MRIILYVVILALLFVVPLEPVDVAKLLPIETVAVYMEDGNVVMETDTQHKGRGENVADALENLKAVTPAVVYLDTACYLLISEDAMHCVDQLKQYLKPSVDVAICDDKDWVKDAAKYLSVHGGTVPLKQLKSDNFDNSKKVKKE